MHPTSAFHKNDCPDTPPVVPVITMVSGKRLADVGYRVFSGSMMLLTLYGGYLCVMRGYRYVQRQKELQAAAERQTQSD
ncbi:cytochrome c oxidase assembly protein COX14-like [Scleropages formosus]|uniref:Cytochrome c oxidase assembly protein COX14-like n=2 Tax=Scleropages formosus TaxID=113540 RepID=A0A0P7XPN1_SCLFO|nr:cytochrome c oxidase assembly protein COX14-like [Scleropages formosus]